MRRSAKVNQVIKTTLYIVGVGLILMAVLIVLQGTGVLPTIPSYVVWAGILIAIGVGMIRSMQR